MPSLTRLLLGTSPGWLVWLHLSTPQWSLICLSQASATTSSFGGIVTQRLDLEGLPIGSRLKAAGLDLWTCPICNRAIETVLHTFCNCPDTFGALSMSQIPAPIIHNNAASVLLWLNEAIATLDLETFTKFLAETSNLNMWPGIPIQALVVWTRPPRGYIKINVDVAFDLVRGANIGVIARNDQGLVLGGFAQHSPGSSEVSNTKITVVIARLWPICIGTMSFLKLTRL
ncbi:hypothetical protein V6N11_001226 [Hibiscus sabdariffa]|uniref:Reverse transcriptase zinc-binding domain-containing protein n=1 Tax=Hibiscus sabdariffa TaxID=183260 RepID=A0ABR2RZL7_9ROSI